MSEPAIVPWSEAMVSALTENSMDIISLLDAQGRLLYNSPATERINGFKPEELAGKDTFAMIHPEDRAGVAAIFQAVVASPGAVRTMQYRYATRDGGWQWMEAVASNQLENPNVRGIVANTRDISARRRDEEDRAALDEQLARARQLDSLGALAGGVAHDFNNLLSVVMGEATLLAASGSPEQAREAATNIVAAARRAAELTQLLLACAGRARFTRAPISLTTLVTELTPELRAAVRADSTFTVSVEPQTPRIEAAEERLRQVLVNLVRNAAEALSAPGRVQLRVGHALLDAASLAQCQLREGLEPGPAVFLEVSDTGQGMSPETVQRMFEPYFTTHQIGRGLGLAAVAGIVRGFRGAIGVRSAPGAGSTLTVWFATSKTEPAISAPQPARFRSEGLVLVVDDEPLTARIACRVLESFGLQAVTAVDGLDALERYGATLDRLRLVLLDVAMPRLDGPHTFQRMRAIRADLPVVFYSGYDAGAVEQALRQPLTAFVQKPFELAALEACLRGLLGAQAGAQ